MGSTPDDGAEFGQVQADRRLDQLDARLNQIAAKEAERTGQISHRIDANERLGNRVLADLIGGIAGGALIGWVIDHFAGSWPWGFVIFLFLGIVVAFRNIFRIANAASKASADE